MNEDVPMVMFAAETPGFSKEKRHRLSVMLVEYMLSMCGSSE